MTNDDQVTAPGTAPVATLALDGLKAAPELDDEADRVLGARLAGGLHLVLAVLNAPFVIRALEGPPTFAPLLLLIDLIIAVALLKGTVGLRGVVLVRIAFEVVSAAVTGDLASAALQMLVLSFMGVLLVGTPRSRRRRFGVVLGTTVALLMGTVSLSEFTDINAPAVDGPLVEIDDQIVHGVDAPYTLMVARGFMLRDLAAARVDRADVDSWAVDRHGSHVLTICHDISGLVDEAAYVDNAIDGLLRKGHKMRGRTQPPVFDQRRLARLELDGEPSFLIDVNTRGEIGCVVHVFAPSTTFQLERERNAAILDSFHFTNEEKLLDVDGGFVAGRFTPWHYRALPGFKLVPREAWPADTDDDVDQWTRDPILGEDLLTRCSRAEPGADVDPAAILQELIDGVEDADGTDDGTPFVVERLVVPAKDNAGHGRATVTSSTYITIVDAVFHDDVSCVNAIALSRRHADLQVPLLRALDTFTFTAPPASVSGQR